MDPGRARQLLEAHRESVLEMGAREREALAEGARDGIFGELSGTDQHQADHGTETFERERDATIARLADEVAADIHHALLKLADGTYGSCETCGDAISDERLEARPEARFCEEHERMWELSRIALDVPGRPEPQPEAPEPGWAELDAMPDEDELAPRTQLDPEEVALHVERVPEPMTADEVEEAEWRELDDLADESLRNRQRDLAEQGEVDEVARDEDALGR